MEVFRRWSPSNRHPPKYGLIVIAPALFPAKAVVDASNTRNAAADNNNLATFIMSLLCQVELRFADG
jgi:hypothetical protein